MLNHVLQSLVEKLDVNRMT